jgi:hypothetical protein
VALQLADQPRDLLLDVDGDLVVKNGGALSRGLVAVVQACRIALQLFAGEWFLDLDAGIAYWESILGQKAPVAIQAANIALRQELLKVDDVLAVTRLDISFEARTRVMRVVWQVSTAFGETPIDTIVLRSTAAAG